MKELEAWLKHPKKSDWAQGVALFRQYGRKLPGLLRLFARDETAYGREKLIYELQEGWRRHGGKPVPESPKPAAKPSQKPAPKPEANPAPDHLEHLRTKIRSLGNQRAKLSNQLRDEGDPEKVKAHNVPLIDGIVEIKGQIAELQAQIERGTIEADLPDSIKIAKDIYTFEKLQALEGEELKKQRERLLEAARKSRFHAETAKKPKTQERHIKRAKLIEAWLEKL